MKETKLYINFRTVFFFRYSSFSLLLCWFLTVLSYKIENEGRNTKKWTQFCPIQPYHLFHHNFSEPQNTVYCQRLAFSCHFVDALQLSPDLFPEFCLLKFLTGMPEHVRSESFCTEISLGLYIYPSKIFQFWGHRISPILERFQKGFGFNPPVAIPITYLGYDWNTMLKIWRYLIMHV